MGRRTQYSRSLPKTVELWIGQVPEGDFGLSPTVLKTPENARQLPIGGLSPHLFRGHRLSSLTAEDADDRVRGSTRPPLSPQRPTMALTPFVRLWAADLTLLTALITAIKATAPV